MASGDTLPIFGVNWTLHENSLFTMPPLYDVNALKWLKNNYKPADNDIFIATYPKTGTTFTQQICHKIMQVYYNKTKDENHKYYKQSNGYYGASEWIEICKKDNKKFETFINATKNTIRFWKTHAKFDYLPVKTMPKKMIIVCRNPKDALVSFYHHLCNLKHNPFDKEFNIYYTLWIAGLIAQNSYFEYYKKYWSLYTQSLKKNDIDILWLNYEDLVINDTSKRREIMKLIKFIGIDGIVNSKQDIDEIIYGSSVKEMRKQYGGPNMFIKNFIRKGVIGDWKNYLSQEQSEIIDGLIKVHFNGTDFKYYKDLMNKEKYLLKSKL